MEPCSERTAARVHACGTNEIPEILCPCANSVLSESFGAATCHAFNSIAMYSNAG